MGIGKWLFNNSESTKSYGHGDISPSQYWEIPSVSVLDRITNLDSLFSDVSSGAIKCSRDGSSLIEGNAADNWSFLKSSSEFYKKTQSLGIPMVATYESEGEFLTYVSHDFSDKTTWFMGSSRVEGETAQVDPNDNKIYALANENIIDLTHGKVTMESQHSDDYAVKVFIDDVLQSSGYEIDYYGGRVIFDSSPGASTVKVDYSYASESKYVLKPEDGKKLFIRKTELQFTSDIRMKETSMQIWVYNPQDLPNKILYEEVVYKSVKDVLNISNLCFTVPAFHDLKGDLYVFPFDYVRTIVLDSAVGAELRIVIKDNEEYSSSRESDKHSFATVSFYCGVE